VRHKAEEGRWRCATCASVPPRARRHGEGGDLSSDELERVEKDLDKITQEQVAAIDESLLTKSGTLEV